MPRRVRRAPRRCGLIGLPGWPPGNSQVLSSARPMEVWRRPGPCTGQPVRRRASPGDRRPVPASCIPNRSRRCSASGNPGQTPAAGRGQPRSTVGSSPSPCDCAGSGQRSERVRAFPQRSRRGRSGLVIVWRSESHRYGIPARLNRLPSYPVIGLVRGIEGPDEKVGRSTGGTAQHGEGHARTVMPADTDADADKAHRGWCRRASGQVPPVWLFLYPCPGSGCRLTALRPSRLWCHAALRPLLYPPWRRCR
jgi:hypothetical protein